MLLVPVHAYVHRSQGVAVADVFSVDTWSGTNAALAITNGVNLSANGGLVWIKRREVAGSSHVLSDSARGRTVILATNSTSAEAGPDPSDSGITAFNTNGFSLGTNYWGDVNAGGGATYVAWTFRKAAKFFDVVTYTGNGSNRTISHNLGATPGMIVIKKTNTTADWQVYHASMANTDYLVLNGTAAAASGSTRWNSTTATSSVFSVGTDTTVNNSGATYVAYLFAHDPTGIVQCGSFSTDSGGLATVTLGWQPQFLLMKSSSDSASEWYMLDTARGWSAGAEPALVAQSSGSEFSADFGAPSGTGFTIANSIGTSRTFIYLAIKAE